LRWASMGHPIGTFTIAGGAGTMKPSILTSDLRRRSVADHRRPPQPALRPAPILSGPFVERPHLSGHQVKELHL
jgi:hypothetical protein